MGIKTFIFLSGMVLSAGIVKAQQQPEFSGPFPKSTESSASSAVDEPLHQTKVYSSHKAKPYKLKRQKVTHTAQYEFYKRVEEAAKEHQRTLKKLYKPQYSNFLYYGHKRKPKKHSPDKMRYCKECGIRH